MRLTVLGKSPSWQDRDGACSGYLVEVGAVKAVLDCGSGVFGKLRTLAEYRDINLLLISHLHADHILDLVPFAQALIHGPRPAGEARRRPICVAPPGAIDAFRRLGDVCGSPRLLEQAFDCSEYDPQGVFEFGDLRVRFAEVPHFIESYAVELQSAADASRITFGADCGPNDAIISLARDTDLLVLEATLERPDDAPRGHLTAGEAGAHAAAAGARRLVITHISDELDLIRAREVAQRAFGGPVELAREGACYAVGASDPLPLGSPDPPPSATPR